MVERANTDRRGSIFFAEINDFPHRKIRNFAFNRNIEIYVSLPLHFSKEYGIIRCCTRNGASIIKGGIYG